MRNVRIPGGTHDVGEKQGYIGISVMYATETHVTEGRTVQVPCYKMVYKPDHDELKRLKQGAGIMLTILGSPPVVPHRIDVLEV